MRKQSPKRCGVSFRLSAHEYERLLELTQAAGAETISEFVRFHISRILTDREAAVGMSRQELQQKVEWLKREVQDLARLVES